MVTWFVLAVHSLMRAVRMILGPSALYFGSMMIVFKPHTMLYLCKNRIIPNQPNKATLFSKI